MDDHHGAHVGVERVGDPLRVGAVAPVALQPHDVEAEPGRHRPPERREVAGLGRDHLVAGRERVDQRGLPRAGAGRGIDDHRPARSRNTCRRPSSTSRPELREVRTAVVDRGRVDRPQHPVGDVRGAGDLQEVTAGSIHQTFHTLARGHCRWSWRSWRPRWSGSWRARCATTPTRGTCSRPTRACSRSSRWRSPSRATPTTSRRRCASRARLGVPIVPRGGGTSLAGQTAGGRGLVLDLSRHMNAIGADRRRRAARARRAGRRAGGPQPRGQALRARVRAGHVDVEPGDARRHDRQQLLGQRVDRLRHDDRSRRSSSRSCSPTARAPRSRATRRRAARSSGASTRRRGDAARARAGDRRGLPEALAPVGRLPARPARPVRPVQADRRLRGHARDRHRRRRSGWSSCRRRRCSRSGTSTRCWARSTPPHDALELAAVGGRDDRPHDPRRSRASKLEFRQPRRPPRRRPGARCCSSPSPATPRTRSATSSTSSQRAWDAARPRLPLRCAPRPRPSRTR